MNIRTSDILLNSPLFGKALRENLEIALSNDNYCETDFKSGENILPPRESISGIGIIISGSAKVYSVDGDRNVLLRRLETEDMFGVASLFNRERSNVSIIIAGKNCSVLFISSAAISKLLESDKNFMYAYIEFLSGRIRFLNRKIAFYTSGSAERRLALYLSSFESENVTVDLHMNSLSELLDIGRASLYRAIDKLVAENFIKRDGENFILVNRQAMLDYYKIQK